MKNFWSLIFLLTISFASAAEKAFSFGRDVPWKKSSAIGKFSISADNVLSIDGKTAGVNVASKQLHNPEKGITVMAVVKLEDLPGLTTRDKMYDSIICRRHQFMMGFYEGRFYVNFHNGKKWYASNLLNLKHNDSQFHSYAMSVKRIVVPSQGEDYLNLKLYYDGKLVLRKKIINGSIADNPDVINIGYSSSFGKEWYLGGKILDARGYNRVLSDSEIEKYTAQFKEIKNQTRMSEAAQKLFDSLPQKGSAEFHAAVSAVKNLTLKTKKFNWMKAAKALKSDKVNPAMLEKIGLYQYKLDGAILTVGAAEGYADAASLFDTVNKRELLRYDNPFFRYWIKRNKFSPTDANAVSGFVRNGDKKFTLKYKFKNASATLDFDCSGKRINYSLKVIPAKNVSLDNVDFPALEINNFSPEATLFTPAMSGVEYPAACSNLINYEASYPRGVASMQYGAFYDADGGIFWSPADPLARLKEMTFNAGSNRLAISYQWYPVQKSAFDPGCPVQLELFKGNWFEAAMIYKKMLTDIDALYWIKQPLPRRDSPEWLKNNTLWIEGTRPSMARASQYKQLRDYFGLPFAVHLYHWNGKVFDRDYPHHRALPSFLNIQSKLQSMGIRVTPYINGRLWEFLDRREDDYLYSKLGKANCVRYKDGTLATAVFNKKQFAIICPYTPVYEDMMRKSNFMLEQMGSDGIYIDQIGASTHIMCYDKSHGHAIPDDKAWFLKGHHKVYSKIREEMKIRNPDVILTTEDNAETCIRNFDALLSWRWMYDGQVPAFSAVYAGRTQLCGLTYSLRTDAESSFAKAAWQLIGAGQIGWFTEDYIRVPEKHDFRVWVKQLMRLRLALLPFFNEGEMIKPAEFKAPVKTKRLFWGSHGTRYINTPDIYSTSWAWNGSKAVILINNTPDKVANKITFDGVKNGKVYIFDSSNKEKTADCSGKFEYAFELAPRSFQLLIAVPDGFKDQNLIPFTRGQFKVIAAAPTDYDPMAKEQPKIANYNPLSWITIADTGRFRCNFFPGAMYPNAFTSRSGTELAAVRFNDNIKIGNEVYYLDCDRWAERKVIENTKERFIIELYGTFCTARHENAAKDVKAVYRYTFERNSNMIEVEAKVTVPQNLTSMPNLLQLHCDNKSSGISWEISHIEEHMNTYTRRGKIFIK